MTPEITVGISFKNPGRFFLPALQSVFAQSFQNWELLLVDDGSTDGPVELARGIRDKRVRLVYDGANRNLNSTASSVVSFASLLSITMPPMIDPNAPLWTPFSLEIHPTLQTHTILEKTRLPQ